MTFDLKSFRFGSELCKREELSKQSTICTTDAINFIVKNTANSNAGVSLELSIALYIGSRQIIDEESFGRTSRA